MDTISPRIASEALDSLAQLRARTRRVRRGGWLPVLLFGLATFASLPFYRTRLSCGTQGQVCGAHFVDHRLRVFSSLYPSAGVGRWLSLYWIVSVSVVFVLTLVYYRRLGITTGVRGRTWPPLAAGAVLLAVILMAAGWLDGLPVRIGAYGIEPLAVVAISLVALAVSERSAGMVLFATGFVVLVGVSLFYNDVNVLRRLGLSELFSGSASLLPNVLVPGAYLVVGGFFFGRAMRSRADGRGELGARLESGAP